MTRSISSVLREAAEQELVLPSVSASVREMDAAVFVFSKLPHHAGEYFFTLAQDERSAFLYLCSLIAEDEHG